MNLKSNNFVLDSWALFAHIRNEEPAATRVEQLLKLGLANKVNLFLSIINLGEIYYTIGRRSGIEVAKRQLQFVQNLPIEILPVSERDVLQASEFKMRYAISYADCFVVATAKKLDAVLVTGDPEIFALEGEIMIERLHRF